MTAPQGEQLLLPYAAELAAVAVQRHQAPFHASICHEGDELAHRIAAWVCRLAGVNAAAAAAAEHVLQGLLDPQQDAGPRSAIRALHSLVQSEAGRQMLLQADPERLQRRLLQLLQGMAAAADDWWVDEASSGSVFSDDDDEGDPVYEPSDSIAADVVAVLLGV